MKKLAAQVAAALLAFGLAAPNLARAEDFVDLDNPGAWLLLPEWTFGVVATGFGTVLHVRPVPILQPKLGCYFTRQRLDGAWRQVQVCY